KVALLSPVASSLTFHPCATSTVCHQHFQQSVVILSILMKRRSKQHHWGLFLPRLSLKKKKKIALEERGPSPSLLLYLLPRVPWLTGNFYILSSRWARVSSPCCLALDSSSSSPCPAFLAIAKSVPFICRLTHTQLPKLLPSILRYANSGRTARKKKITLGGKIGKARKHGDFGIRLKTEIKEIEKFVKSSTMNKQWNESTVMSLMETY
ncbi:hypothetical protein STEG23_018648, partial [Scotinomys teguina]